MESKKFNNVSKITKRNRLTDIENKLVFTSTEREVERGNTGVKSLSGTKYYVLNKLQGFSVQQRKYSQDFITTLNEIYKNIESLCCTP